MKDGASLRNGQKIAAIKKIHAEFKDILKHEKCRSCSCFHGDILNSIFEKINKFRIAESDDNLVKIQDDFGGWIKEADFLKMHG